MPLPLRHQRMLLLVLLLPFAALGGAVAAGRIQVRLGGSVSCADGLGNELADCLVTSANAATLFAGALLAALVVVYATVQLTAARLQG